MNEARSDNTRDVAGRAGGTGSYGRDREQRRRLRLNGFLRELVREEGRMEAAELLGVNYRTLVRAEESGDITGRMGDALERLLGTDDEPETERLRERVDALEEGLEQLTGRVEELATELRSSLDEIRALVATDAQDQGEDQDGRVDGEVTGRFGTGTAPPVEGLRTTKLVTERLLDPEVVTEEPAEDDAEVYGAAWPLVEEWRELRAGHPRQGRSLSWLVTEERLLMLELEMLEDYGLTLPPETQPLRGFGRKGQTNWRRTALRDTRKALARRKLLRWVRRILTLGMWWK